MFIVHNIVHVQKLFCKHKWLGVQEIITNHKSVYVSVICKKFVSASPKGIVFDFIFDDYVRGIL